MITLKKWLQDDTIRDFDYDMLWYLKMYLVTQDQTNDRLYLLTKEMWAGMNFEDIETKSYTLKKRSDNSKLTPPKPLFIH